MSFQAMTPVCVRRSVRTVLTLLSPVALALAATAVARADETLDVALHITAPTANHPAAEIPSLQNTVFSKLLLVGGGARANGTGNGSLLTKTAPGPAGTQSWGGAAKDHLAADPATLDVYGVYLAISADDWEIIVREATGAVGAHPVASVSLPPGYVMTSGGCTSNWRTSPNAAGNLLTASFPASPATWECRGKDHGAASPASLTAYVVGIRPKKPGMSPPVMQITTARSGVASHPSVLAPELPGYVVTGGGALVETARPTDPGQLLTASIPETKPLQIGGFSAPPYPAETTTGWRAASKDHAYASPGTVQAFAINLRFGDATTAVGVAIPVAPPAPATQATATAKTGARTPPPGMSMQRQQPTTGAATLVPTLTGPSAPGPQALTARTHGTYVQLTWEPISGAREYMIWRSVGQQKGVKITPPNFTGNELWDAVENPADTYRYSVAVMYTDGRSGNAQVEAKRPFSTPNPGSLKAERVGTADVADVRFTWPETFGAVAYRIDGGNLPTSGSWVDGGKFTPPAKWTGSGSNVLSVVLPGAAGTGAQNFTIMAIYPHALGDYAARPAATLPAIAGRYRITLNGFRCNTMTADDWVDRDGKADEIYPLVYVHDIDRTKGIERAAYYVRTPVYGDASKSPAWLHAGSGQPNGGVMTGDDVPRVAVAGVRAGPVPATRSEVQPLPMLVWSGVLKNRTDALLVKPSIWEHDGGTHIFDPWLSEQRQASLPTLLQAVGEIDGRTGATATTVAGQSQSRFITFRTELGLLNFFMSNTDDRPIGINSTRDNFSVQQPVVILTREIIEAELARAPGQLTNGVIPVTFTDTTDRGATGSSYTVYLQVERMP